MAQHAMYDKADDVRKNFVRNKFPFYIVADGKGETIWLNDDEKDIDEAGQMLFDDLNTIRDYNTAIYTIKHFAVVPKSGLKRSTEPDCISTFKKGYSEIARNDYMQQKFSTESATLQLLQEMKNEIIDLKMKVAVMDSETDDEIEEETTAVGVIGKFLGNPGVQNQLINLLTNISANLFTNNIPMTKLAGTQKVETVEDVINRLISKGVTVEDLQKLSNMEAGQISMLLNLLRSQ